MKIKGIKQEDGITIVSLVVTIIVLIILAGISISLLFGKSGIITRAKKGQEIADVATAQDKLELIKSEIPMKILEGKDSTVNLNNYLEELNKDKNKKDCDVTNIEKLNDINAEITISGKYKFLAKDEENGNVKIIYLGEAGGLQISPTEATYRYPTAGTFEVISNESQGKLTVKSSNEEIAKASISGTTVTVTPQKMAGTAKIVVTSEANGKYAEGRVTHTAKVENGTILLEAEPYIGEYDGKAHDALISVTVEPKDCKLEYSLNGGKFTEVMPKVTMAADEYTISIKASKEGYTTNAITKTVTINKQTNTNGNLVLTPTSGTITYPNNGTFTVSKNVSGGALSVKSSDESIATASISGTTVTVTPKTPSVNGKQVTITVTSAATSNYEAQTATYVAKIEMGTITINATPYKGNYDGKSHPALTAVSTEPTGTTLRYNLDGKGWQTSIPEVTGAGSYTIAIEASKAGYVTKTKTDTISTINKQTNTNGNLVLTPTSGTIIYPNNGTFTVSKNVSGGALSVKSSDESIATASISGTTVTVTPKTPSVNGKQVTITVTSVATSNYEAQTATYIATVKMGTITINATPYKGTYDGKQYDALTNVKVLPDGCNVEYALNGGKFGRTIPKVTNAGTFSVTVKATKAGYVEKVATITNGKIDNSTTATASGVNKVYNGSAQTGVTGNNVDWSGTTSATNAGTYTAYATPQTNYAWSDGTKTQKEITWKITPAEITLDATVYSGTYDGKAHNAVSNVKVTPSDCKVEYSLNGGTYSSTMPTVTNAGSFSVAIRASKSNYTTKEITKTSKIENAKTATASAVNRTYNGSAQTGVTGNNVDWSGTTSATNAGTYTAYATPKTNYSWSDGKVDKRAVVWKIGEATITITATPYSGTYDGKAHQALTSVKVVPDGCTVTYSLNGGTYSSTMPTVTNVGAFTVSIKATKANYTTKEITINTGKVNYSKASSASGINKVYNGSAQTGVTGQYVTWGGTTSETNVGTYTAYATPDSNHAWSDGTRTQKTIQWSITPAEITLDATVYSGTYDGKAHNTVSNVKVTPSDSTITYSIDGGKTYTSTVPTVTNAESFSVIVKATRANYSTKTITKTSKIENAKTATSSAVNRTYNGSAQTGVTGNNVDWSGTTSATNAGSYTAYATPKANYAWSDGKTDRRAVVWTMGSATITLDFTAYNAMYDGKAHNAVSNVKVTPSDCTITYSISGGAYSTTIPTVTGAAGTTNSYSVSVKATKANYTTREVTKTVYVNKDTVTPSVPTITYNGGANTCTWKNNYNITLSSTDANSGISGYQVDDNGDGVADRTTGANFIPPNGYNTHNARFRAVDGAGNVSGWTAEQHIHMDTQAPTKPTITYNSGSNTCTWQSNINISLSSSDNVAIYTYEIDYTGDGNANATTGTNFVPGNGWHSHTNRFRAVDYAGNKSEWSDEVHIHQDTTTPTISCAVSSGTPGQNGWYLTDVYYTFTISGGSSLYVFHCWCNGELKAYNLTPGTTNTVTVGPFTSSQDISYAAYSYNGLNASGGLSIRIDKTPPSARFTEIIHDTVNNYWCVRIQAVDDQSSTLTYNLNNTYNNTDGPYSQGGSIASTTANVAQLGVTYKGETTCGFQLSVTDAAGNKTTTYCISCKVGKNPKLWTFYNTGEWCSGTSRAHQLYIVPDGTWSSF